MMLRSDFLDADVWAELAKARKLRLPLWRQRCSRGQMGKWLKRLGISMTTYQEWSGEKTLAEFPSRNPDWPLRAWVGLLLEWDKQPNLDTRKRKVSAGNQPSLLDGQGV